MTTFLIPYIIVGSSWKGNYLYIHLVEPTLPDDRVIVSQQPPDYQQFSMRKTEDDVSLFSGVYLRTVYMSIITMLFSIQYNSWWIMLNVFVKVIIRVLLLRHIVNRRITTNTK